MAMRCFSLKECLRTRSGVSSYSMDTLIDNQEQQNTSARPLYFQSGSVHKRNPEQVACQALSPLLSKALREMLILTTTIWDISVAEMAKKG